MSHVPCDLAGGTPGPVGACCAIVKVEPTRVSTSGSKWATSILIFIVILSGIGLGVPIRRSLARVLAAEFLRTFYSEYVKMRQFRSRGQSGWPAQAADARPRDGSSVYQ